MVMQNNALTQVLMNIYDEHITSPSRERKKKQSCLTQLQISPVFYLQES